MRLRTAWISLGILSVFCVAELRAAEPLRFCVTADSHGSKVFPSILESMARTPGGPGAFMISAGDANPAVLTRAQIDAAFGKSFVWYPAVGNHEALSSGEDPDSMSFLREYYEKNLKGKVNPGPDGARQTTYSFDAGDVHIAVINQYWNGKAAADNDCALFAGLGQPLRTWLQKDLQNSSKTWKIVVGHEPVFPQADKDWNTSRHLIGAIQVFGALHIFGETPAKQFWSILEEQHVAAYICGHTHRYSRYQPPGSKVWQINTGQARSNKDWKYDAFIIVTADAAKLQFDVYRNLKEQGKFEVTDSLTLQAADAPRPNPGEPPGAAQESVRPLPVRPEVTGAPVR